MIFPFTIFSIGPMYAHHIYLSGTDRDHTVEHYVDTAAYSLRKVVVGIVLSVILILVVGAVSPCGLPSGNLSLLPRGDWLCPRILNQMLIQI